LGFAGYYLASTLDFAGLQYVSAGFERLVIYLNPTLVLLIGLVWFKRRVGAPLAAQTGMIGPMSTVLLGVLILDEPFTPWVAAGMALVLAGVWLLSKWR
jgi:drug/metabolite transporter (DMT)-like permease